MPRVNRYTDASKVVVGLSHSRYTAKTNRLKRNIKNMSGVWASEFESSQNNHQTSTNFNSNLNSMMWSSSWITHRRYSAIGMRN